MKIERDFGHEEGCPDFAGLYSVYGWGRERVSEGDREVIEKLGVDMAVSDSHTRAMRYRGNNRQM
jgi:hypothetical protein